MSVTPFRLSRTTSFAFMSSASMAARFASESGGDTAGLADEAIQFGKGMVVPDCKRITGAFDGRVQQVPVQASEAGTAAAICSARFYPNLQYPPLPAPAVPAFLYCLITQTLISGCTSACKRIGTRYTPSALIGSLRSIWRFSTSKP